MTQGWGLTREVGRTWEQLSGLARFFIDNFWLLLPHSFTQIYIHGLLFDSLVDIVFMIDIHTLSRYYTITFIFWYIYMIQIHIRYNMMYSLYFMFMICDAYILLCMDVICDDILDLMRWMQFYILFSLYFHDIPWDGWYGMQMLCYDYVCKWYECTFCVFSM